MTISKYTNNLYKSEVYRELERQAVKKGFFKPTDGEVVKLAAQAVSKSAQINQEIDSTCSDDLIADIARLAYAMRRKGFISQAEEVEQNLVMFKQAECSLYDVTDETNKDLIGFAHRDGDVNVLEGSGELGTFETMQSISDKIQSMIKKEPTGINRMAELAGMINKVGQVSPVPGAPGSSFFGGESGSNVGGGPVTTYNADVKPLTKSDMLERVQGALVNFDTIRKTQAPSVEELAFADLTNTEQQTAYVYLASKTARVDPRRIAAWYAIKDHAARTGILGGTAELPIVTVEGLVANLRKNINLAVQSAKVGSGSTAVQSIAQVLGTLEYINSTYFLDTSPTYVLANGYNEASVNAVCTTIAQQVRALYASCFGANNEILLAATGALRDIPARLYKMVEEIPLEGKLTDTESALRILIRTAQATQAAQKQFTASAKTVQAVNVDFVKRVNEWVGKLIESVYSEYKSLATSSQLKPFSVNTAKLEATQEYWADYSRNQATDQADTTRAETIAGRISTLVDIIKQYENKPWIELQEALKRAGIEAINQSVFLASLKQIENSAKGRI